MDCRTAPLFGELRRFILPITTRRVSEVRAGTSLTRRVKICTDKPSHASSSQAGEC